MRATLSYRPVPLVFTNCRVGFDPTTGPYYITFMRRARRSGDVPIVALLTDFGLLDTYVAEMKGVLLANCPTARLVDVTHQVPPQDVLTGSILLERVLRVFTDGTVHIVVVDPGVGTDRRLLLAVIGGQFVLCPDNGLLTWPLRRLGMPAKVYELTYRPGPASPTFHGRDILALAAAALASGDAVVSDLAGDPVDPVMLDVAPATGDRPTKGTIIHLDHFGNATTNVPGESVEHAKRIKIRGKSIGPVRRTYGDVTIGKPLALVCSSGLLEIAVRNGSAATSLGLKVGTTIAIEY